jgi:hypothetical protein
MMCVELAWMCTTIENTLKTGAGCSLFPTMNLHIHVSRGVIHRKKILSTAQRGEKNECDDEN